MDLGAALLALLIAGVVKVLVMIIGARMLLRLYRATGAEPPKRLWLLLPKENLPEIRVLWWSLFLFCVSELTCGIEVYVILRANVWTTSLHSVTSGVGMALFALGCTLYLDKELLRYGRPACLLNRICRGCTFDAPERCKFLHVILFIGTFVALASIVPFFTPVEALAANTKRYALPFPELNAWYDQVAIPWMKSVYPDYSPTGEAFVLPPIMSVIEFRIEPAISLILAIAAIVCAQSGREILGAKLLALSVGMLCYVYFELVLYRTMGDPLIGSLGHEVAELWFLLVTAEFLRRSFDPQRRGVHPIAVGGGEAA